MITESYIRLSSGKLVNLLDLKPGDVELKSISQSLNMIRRFTGHWDKSPPLTVAQHTILVMEICSRLYPDRQDVEFDCLLHDFPEAYYGDLSTPVKNCLRHTDAYDKLIGNVDRAVYQKLWTLQEIRTPDTKKKTKECDHIALHIERNMMWNTTEGNDDPKYFPQIEVPFNNEEQEFLFSVASNFPAVDLEGLYNQFQAENDVMNRIIV